MSEQSEVKTEQPSTTSSESSQPIQTEIPKDSSEQPEVKSEVQSSPAEAASKETPEQKVEDQFEEYELELPENSSLTVEDLNQIAEEASKLGLTKAEAEKLIASREGLYQRGLSKAEEVYVAKIQKARHEIESHPDFSGDKKVETFAAINRAVTKFGDPELINLLNTPEVGNNIVIAKFLKRLGDAIAPDTIPGKGTTSAESNSESNTLKALYPDFYK